MRSSDFLFQLIKSLNKGDRRNFKLYARLQDGDKKYIRLFDAIDKQSKYDEKRLLRQFEGERFTNQFSVAKNYLYNYILKTLDIFHQDKISELRIMLHKIEILIGKNLFEQAQKLLRKAKHAAERQERFGEMLELLNFERQILHRLQKSNAFEVFIEGVQQEEEVTLKKMENLQLFYHLYDEIYRYKKRVTSIRGVEDEATLANLLSDPLLDGPERAISTRARLKQLDILNDVARFKQDYQACIKYSESMVKIYDEHPALKEEKNLRYIETVHKYGMFLCQIGKVEEGGAAIDKLRQVKTYNEQETIKVVELYFSSKMALCVELAEVEEGEKVIADFETEFEKRLSGKLMKSVELTIYYLTSLFYIWDNKPSVALGWVNKILNEPRTELRTDLQCMARILNLIIHLELGNEDLLEYNLKSATRFISNRNRMFGFEKMLLKHLRQLANQGPNESSETLLLAFQEDLNLVLEDSFEKRALELFNAPLWVTAKLNGMSPMEYLKKDMTMQD